MPVVLSTLQQQFGRRVRQKRKLLRLSQSELAQAVGTKQAAIGRIETGRGNPTLNLVQRIVNALEMQGTLFLHPDPPEPGITPKWLTEPDD